MHGACRWRCCVAHAATVFRRMFSNFGIVAQMYSISASVVGCQRGYPIESFRVRRTMTATGESQFVAVSELAQGDNPVVHVESLCLRCEKQGETRLLLVRIPHFREVLVSSFNCPNCGWRDSGVQETAEIGETGVCYELAVRTPADLQRTVVLSAYASVRVPELELEAPASGRGRFTTVEGLVTQMVDDLRSYVNECDKLSEDEAGKLRVVVSRLEAFAVDGEGFHIIVDDPAGNSFLDILDADGKPCSSGTMRRYPRTHEMNVRLGLSVDEDAELNGRTSRTFDQASADGQLTAVDDAASTRDAAPDFSRREVLRISTECPACGKMGENRIHETNIPHFRDILLIAFTCEHCGFKSTEVKPSGHCAEKGQRITLHVQSREDFSRDLIKSDTARLVIPQVHLELEPGTLGSKFTTVEGIVRDAREALGDLRRFVQSEDFKPDEVRQQQERFQDFLRQLDMLLDAPNPQFDLILDDPLGNSYIQNPCAPNVDPQLEIEEYERTPEMNEALGIVAPAEGAGR
jgi:zinc finger protein